MSVSPVSEEGLSPEELQRAIRHVETGHSTRPKSTRSVTDGINYWEEETHYPEPEKDTRLHRGIRKNWSAIRELSKLANDQDGEISRLKQELKNESKRAWCATFLLLVFMLLLVYESYNV